ncbi:MAG: hypothetical protein ACOH1M_08015 [Rhodoglobus sp.]
MTFDTDTLADAETSTDANADAETGAAVNAGTGASIALPRIRFGTIVWGLLVFAAGATLLTALRTPGRRDQLADWALSLAPSDSMLIVTIVVGAIVLILGLLAVIRSQQKRWSRG